jgi:uncharacterized alkaline shock family protein YloU
MSKELQEKKIYQKLEEGTIGEVQISDEVVAIIAGLAATDVKGVHSMAGNITNELVSKLGMKNLAKGVKVRVEEKKVMVNLALNLEYGYNIPATCEKIQDRVKTAIENMTGLEVGDINIRIAGVNMQQ